MAVEPILKPVAQSVAFPELLEQLNAHWEDGQHRRLKFYNWVTPNIKAEFIEGEIVVHSPVRRCHNAATGMLFSLLHTYVIRNGLG